MFSNGMIALNVPQYSVVLPCFDEEQAIGPTIAQLIEHLAVGPAYEVIIVDDGSTDGTVAIVDRACHEYEQIRMVRHTRNRGYGAALKSGIKAARSEWIVTTDADGTYPNERIPEFVGLAENADMVVGSRTAADADYPVLRAIPKAFLRRYCSWLVAETIPDMNSGLRVFRKGVAEKYMKILPDTFSFTTTITLAMMRNRYRVEFVPIGYARRVGRSKLKPIRDTLRFAQLIVRSGMYFAPLRVLAPIVAVLVVLFLVSVCYDLFVLANLTDKTVILLMFAMNTTLFALLADMIDKRSSE